jgi:hypothetical protein
VAPSRLSFVWGDALFSENLDIGQAVTLCRRRKAFYNYLDYRGPRVYVCYHANKVFTSNQRSSRHTFSGGKLPRSGRIP